MTISKATRKRLVKLAGSDGIAVLQDLFNCLEDGQVTLPAVSFRVDHETKLECIQRLGQRTFIKHDHDAVETYRLRLIALVVIPESRAQSILQTCDKILRYMDERFRKDPDNKNNKVTVAEIANNIELSNERILEALNYLTNTPGINPASTNFPNGPEPYLFAGEQSLLFGAVEPLISQLIDWVGTSATMPLSLIDEQNGANTKFDQVIAAFKNNRVLAWLLIAAVGISGLSVFVASMLYLIGLAGSWLG